MAEIMKATIRIDDERMDRLFAKLKIVERRYKKWCWQNAIRCGKSRKV